MTVSVARVAQACLAVVVSQLVSESSAAEATVADFSRVMRRWGVDDGLIGGRVDGVVQTPDGYLWVGTEFGLFRFNGRQFERIDTETVPELGHRWVTSICLDGAGDLWVVVANGRIAVFRDGEFAPVTQPWEPPNRIWWCAHPREGVFAAILVGSQVTFAHATRSETALLGAFVDAPVQAVHATPDGSLWVGLGGRPIAQLVDGALVPGPAGGAPGAGVFLNRRDATQVALSASGIFERDGADWRLRARFESPLEKPPSFAAEDLDGNLWFGNSGAERMVWMADGSLRQLRPGRNSLPAVVKAATVDRDGDLWFATFSGLFQARYLPFLTWTPPVEIPTERVVGVKTRPDGTVWFESFGGICRLPPGGSTPILEAARPPVELTISDADEGGTIWLANRYGECFRIAGAEVTPIPVRGSQGRLVPASLVVDHEGAPWFASFTGLFHCDPQREPLEFLSVSGQDGLPDDGFHHITSLNNGDLLVTARGHGVFQRSVATRRWERLTPPGDPDAAEVRWMDLDPDGRVWGIAPPRGLLGCWDPREGSTLRLADIGLGSVTVNGLVLDAVGNVWMPTRTHGVVTTSCQDLLAAMADPERKPELTWFDPVSGLGSSGGSYTNAAIAKSVDGRIWVATDGGLSVIDPAQWLREKQRASPLAVSLEKCTADGTLLALGPVVEIPAGTARIGLGFAALSFGFPGEVRYRHRLRELGDGWNEDSGNGEAFFQRLRPGRYHFEVAAANRFGTWSLEPATLAIAVLPHWWERTDVRVAIVLALVLGLAGVIWARLNRLHQRAALQAEFSRVLIGSQEEERRRIARELHDSLGQDLLVVKNLAAIGQRKEAAAEAGPQFAQIAGSAAKALEELRAISRALRPPELDRLGIVEAIRATLDRVADSSGLAISGDLDALEGILSPEQEIAVFRILQEALNNVIKHAEATSVRVTARREAGALEVSIADDGRGFDARVDAPGVGLHSITERTRLIGGNVEVRSNGGAGTRVTLRIPSSRGR